MTASWLALTADSDQPGAIQRIDTITPLPEEVDPHAAWDDFEKALKGRRWYSTDAMAMILRRSRKTVSEWKDGREVYPDCFPRSARSAMTSTGVRGRLSSHCWQ